MLAAVALAALLALPVAAAPVRVKLDRKVVSITLEEYVAGALFGEAGGITEPEALKAIAVAIRSYARAMVGRHRAEGYDFCESTHCQDFRAGAVPEALRRAVEETQGEILWYAAKPAEAYHHRHCGGRTAAAAEVWAGKGRPYLVSLPDEEWHRDLGEWQARIPLTDLAKAVGLARLRKVEVRRRSVRGRVMEVALDGRPVAAEALHLAVGRKLGWNLLRSRLYWIDGVTFYGKGAGHAVGLCQEGARGRARGGRGYAAILSDYFPGTSVGVNPHAPGWTRRGTEKTEVLTAGAEYPNFAATADRLAGEAERRAGWGFRQKPVVRIYPTLDLFRELTGEPGWVVASTRGRTIRLQPPGPFLWEPNLLHEMLHVLLNQRAKRPVPEWFEEGLVLHLAGNVLEPGVREADAGLMTMARTEAELRRAYRSAQARVERLIRSYGRSLVLSWLDSGLPANLP